MGPTQEPMCRDDVIDIIYDNPLEKKLGVDGNSALTILGAALHPPNTLSFRIFSKHVTSDLASFDSQSVLCLLKSPHIFPFGGIVSAG